MLMFLDILYHHRDSLDYNMLNKSKISNDINYGFKDIKT